MFSNKFLFIISLFHCCFNAQVDWSIGAGTINYITARNRVPLVADVLARLLGFLVTSGTISNMNRVSIAGMHLFYTSKEFLKVQSNFFFHLKLGHSLGAHIAGITGKRVRSAGNGRLQAVWGLDPAGPLFR